MPIHAPITFAAGQDLSLITTIAAGFAAAWVLGIITQLLKLSPIVGYLLAGVAIGPHTPGFVGDVKLAPQLAEIGVILLMFGVGLHFNLKDLLSVKSVAIPGAVGQSVLATVAGVILLASLGETVNAGIVVGMALAVASTVVLIRVLVDNHLLTSWAGRVAVGWLIVEDIFTVIMLVLIPTLGPPAPAAPAAAANSASADGAAAVVQAAASQPSILVTILIAMAKLVALVIVIALASRFVIPKLMTGIARLRSRELFTLTVMVFSIAVATASYYVFGASVALGAFLAGMAVAQSPVSHQAAADALPLRDAFAVLFFVAVGMVFKPSILIEQPLLVAFTLAIVMILKPLAALAIVAVLGQPFRTGLIVALGLAQIGEFSFILIELARSSRILPDDSPYQHAVVAAAIISITLNPLLFRAMPSMERWLKSRPGLWRMLNARADARTKQANPDEHAAPAADASVRTAIILGYGHVGRAVDQILTRAGLRTVIVDLNMDTVTRLREQGRAAVFGDASRETVLEQAGADHAAYLIVTLPDSESNALVCEAARHMSKDLHILVRARFIRDETNLRAAGADDAIFEELEAAVALSRMVMTDIGVPPQEADRELAAIRGSVNLSAETPPRAPIAPEG